MAAELNKYLLLDSMGNYHYSLPQSSKKPDTGGAAKAVASAIVPGAGQFLDGRNKVGAAYLGASVATVTPLMVMLYDFAKVTKNLSQGGFIINENNIQQLTKYFNKLSKGFAIGILIPLIINPVIWAANIVDAYKGKK